MLCLNHLKREASGTCIICGNPFCETCLESIGDKQICLDCIEEIARSSLRFEGGPYLTVRLIAAVGILLGLGVLVLVEKVPTVFEIVLAVFLGKQTVLSIPKELVNLGVEAIKACAYFSAGYGVMLSRSWSYWVGISIAAGTFLFEFYRMLSGEWNMLALLASAVLMLLIYSSKKDLLAI